MKVNTKNKGKSYYHWLILIAALLFNFCVMGSSYMFSTAMTYKMPALGLTYTQNSFLQTFRTVAAVLGTFSVLRIYDKFTLRWGVGIGFVCAIIGGLLVGSAPNYYVLIAAVFFMGFGGALASGMPAAILINNWFSKKASFVQGVVSAGGSLTAVVIAVPFATLCQSKSVFAAYFVVEVIALIGGLFCMWIVRDTPDEIGLIRYGEDDAEETAEEGEAKEKTSGAANGPLKPMGKSGEMILALVMIVVTAMTYCGWNFFPVAATNMGYNQVFVASMTSLVGAVSMVTPALFGALVDRFGLIKCEYANMVLIVAAHVLLGMLDGTSIPLCVAANFLYGVAALTPSYVGMTLWVSAFTTREDFPRVSRNMRLVMNVSGMIMMPCTGIIADALGGYSEIFFFLGFISIVSPFLIHYLYRRCYGK